jgi:peptide/nickel transport system substrate-binding protein
MHTEATGSPRRRLVILVVAVLLIAGLAWGIAGAFADSSSPSPNAGKVVLKLGWTNNPDNLNPFIGYTASAYEVWALNYDLLCGFAATDMSSQHQGQEAPGLATAWTTSSDGLTWTFTIRSGVKCSDGVPLTAKDVAFTFNYIIKNDESMFTSYTKFITSVDAPNDTTVIFHCSKPKANMTALWIPILPEHIWKDVPGEAAQQSYKMPMPIVGSGPFYTTEWKKNDHVTMVRNPYYWRDKPAVDEVIFQTYTNSDTMKADLQAGALDAAVGLLQGQYRALQGQSGLNTMAYETIGFEEIGFNCYTGGPSLGNPVLKDYKFRQALQWAVDKQELNRIAYGGLGIPADTIINQGYYHSPDWHWTPPADQAYSFDLTKAGQLLDAAGYPLKNGVRVDRDGKPIELRLFTRSEDNATVSVGKLLVGWFGKIGIKVDLTAMDDDTMSSHIYNTKGGVFTPDYDLFTWDWGGDVDPNFILSVFTSDQINSWSDCAWSDPQYDKLFLQQQSTLDVNQRKAIVDQMQQIVYEQSPYIITVYGHDIESFNTSRWTGWVHAPSPKGGVWYTTVPDSYIYLAAQTSAKSSSNTTLIAIIVIVAIVVIALIVWLVLRGGRRAEEVEA